MASGPTPPSLSDNTAVRTSAPGLVPDAQPESENWGISVERRSGANYGVSHYHTALMFGAPEPGRGPKLQDMVNALATTAKRDAVVAQH